LSVLNASVVQVTYRKLGLACVTSTNGFYFLVVCGLVQSAGGPWYGVNLGLFYSSAGTRHWLYTMLGRHGLL
jgi:hypothetical protein